MLLRIGDCGLRISDERSSRARTAILPIRNPKSAIPIALLLAACTPITTRPDFRPDARALTVVLDARPERVTTVLDSLVAAESLEVAHANVRDGYVETAWYETQAHRSRHHEREITNLGATVKIRFWADPWLPGPTRLTGDPVDRPAHDPARVERGLHA